ncbi:MAG: serine hydrolase [Gammaproteobacteria bacterium]|nr:serine hydrolase [Gammaproteobacteria bacterium]
MFRLALGLFALSCPLLLWAAAPYVNPDKDAEYFGDPQQLLFLQGKAKVAAFRNMETLFPTRKIEAAGEASPLPAALRDFSNFTYQLNGQQRTLDDFVDSGEIVGLLIIKNGKVLLERYEAGNDRNTLWTSYSISKSVTSMLLGAAVKDGYIQSVDEKISDYLPRLKGTAYDQATIKNVLQMSSGTQWNEDYADPSSDVNNTPGDVVNLIKFLGTKKRIAPPGERFSYNTGETNLVGAVLRAAIGNNLASYLTDKIWIPYGMESDAAWVLEAPNKGELSGWGLNTTLRDSARLALFALGNGKLRDGSMVLPDSWMTDSTTPSQGFVGYGYLWWLFGDGVYAALGIFGQSIFTDANSKTIIVSQSAWNTAVGEDYQENRRAFMQAMLQALNEETDGL